MSSVTLSCVSYKCKVLLDSLALVSPAVLQFMPRSSPDDLAVAGHHCYNFSSPCRIAALLMMVPETINN